MAARRPVPQPRRADKHDGPPVVDDVLRLTPAPRRRGQPPPAGLLARLLTGIRDELGMDVWFVADSDGGRVAMVDPAAAEDPPTVSVPVCRSDGTPFGTLCARRRDTTALPDAAVLRVLGDVLGVGLSERDEGDVRRRSAARVRELLDTQRLRIALQPIVDMAAGEPVGYEALTRLSGAADDVGRLFAEAAAAGVGEPLELAALQSALARLADVPAGRFLTINLSAETAASPRAWELLRTAERGRVVIELTERSHVADYPRLLRAMTRLRGWGIRFAVDDTGAGYAGLHHLLSLRPEIIKLDGGITHGLAGDPARQAMTRALAWFAREVDATLDAEGVEDERDRDLLLSFGIRFGQGYLLGPPR